MPDIMGTGREITFEEIRERAYEPWDRNHQPAGVEVWFWLLAEPELNSGQAPETSRDEAADAGGCTSGLGSHFVNAFVRQIGGTLATAACKEVSTQKVRLPASVMAEV